MKCEKCGHEIPEESSFCNKCGNKVKNQINNDIESSNKLNNSSENNKRNKLIFSSISIAVFLLGIGFGGWYYVQSNNEKAKEQYKSELEQVVEAMVIDIVDAEEIVNSYLTAWNYSVSGLVGVSIMNGDYENFKIHKLSPNYVDHPDVEMRRADSATKAIKIVNEIYNDLGKIEPLVVKRSVIQEKMKSLNNPPDEYKIAYEIALQLYGNYEEYISMADYPSGNLVSFRNKAQEIPDEILKKLNEFRIRLP